MLSKSAFPSKTPQKYLTHQLSSLKILITKVQRDKREIIPAAQIYLEMSKLSKISKISKFPKLTKIPNHSCIIIFFLFFLLAPNVIVPVVLWAEACPFASSSTAVPVHHGTEHLMCTKISNLSLKWGG